MVMWDEEPELGKAFSKKYGIDFEPDLDKLLSRDDVDAVCINAPTSMEIHGTEGSLMIVGSDVRLNSSKIGTNDYSGWLSPKLPPALPDAVTQFVEGVLYDKEIIFGLDDAIMLTEIMEAAYKAHKQGGFVAV